MKAVPFADRTVARNRPIVFHAADAVPRDVLALCVRAALTCHHRERT
jgi:hypothetical protein